LGCSYRDQVTHHNDDEGHSASAVSSFVEKAKKGDVENEDIFKFAKFFKDDLTLDNMSRTQLVTMCTFMNLKPYGADGMIRFQLRSHVRNLQEDDQRILFEGVDSLDRRELQEACRERGMRATGLPKADLARQLQQWLDLSCNRQVPISLLILSRSFILSRSISAETGAVVDAKAALADVVASLDEELVTEVVLDAATPEERKSKEIRQLKLEAYEYQSELIADERDEKEAEQKEAKEAKKQAVANEQSEELTLVEGEKTDKDSSLLKEAVSSRIPIQSSAGKYISKTKVDTSKEEGMGASAANSGDDVKEDIDDVLNLSEVEVLVEMAGQSAVEEEKQIVDKLKAAAIETEKVLEEITVVVEDVDNNTLLEDEMNDNVDEICSEKKDETEPEVPEKAFRVEMQAEAAIEANPTASDEAIEVVEAEAASVIPLKRTEMQQTDTFSAPTDIQRMEMLTAIHGSGAAFSAKKLEDEEVAARDAARTAAKNIEQGSSADVAVSRVSSKLNSMLQQLEADIVKVDEAIGEKLHVLDIDEDGMMSEQEMTAVLQTALKTKLTEEEAARKVRKLMDEVDLDEDGVVSVEELKKWLREAKRKADR
jgi:ribosomal protein S11